MSNDIHIAEQYDLLDLNTLLITDPPATFFVRVSGNSMIDVALLHKSGKCPSGRMTA